MICEDRLWITYYVFAQYPSIRGGNFFSNIFVQLTPANEFCPWHSPIMNTGHLLSRPSLDENQRLSSTEQVDLSNTQVKPARLLGHYDPSHSPSMNIKHSLSRPSLYENQLLPSPHVHLDGAQVELGQSSYSICSEIVPDDLSISSCAFESSQRHPDGTQAELNQFFGSIRSKIVSSLHNDDLLAFPYDLEISTKGVSAPGGPFARSNIPPVSSATYPPENVPDYFTMKPISKGHRAFTSQPLRVPTCSAHYLASTPQAETLSSSYQLLEPPRQYDLGILGLAQPSTLANSSGAPFSITYDEHYAHLSPCVSSLSQNSAPPSRAETTIESAGSLLGRKAQVDGPGHEVIKSGTERACLQCNNSFKSISELGHHATNLQHDAFKCKCGQPFKRLDSLERHLTKYQPGARQYSCQLCDRYEGKKRLQEKTI